MTFPPTPEQTAAVEAFKTGRNVVIEAGAGSGKTSTLELVAKEAQRQGKRVLYIAFNKSIAKEAQRRFPSNTTCSTAHALAFAAGGKYWADRLRYPRQTAKRTAEALGITNPLALGSDTTPLSPQQVARLALNTVKAFCSTADAKIGAHHVPEQVGYGEPGPKAALAKAIVPLAEKAWADLKLKEGKLRYTHDYYFKRWQLANPTLDYDVICLDEAQDTDPVLAAVVKAQDERAQLVIVGDRCQSIYQWRGSADVMGDFPDAAIVQLTKSFRFGPAIAREANRWLELLDANLRMTGHDPIPSTLGPVTDPDAILCRSNAGAIAELMKAHEAGRKVALVGGGADVKSLAEAAQELQERGYTGHPELSMFQTWGQVQDYVINGDLGSEDLKVAVKLIDDHGADVVIDAIERLVDERFAEVTVSTAHKSKGREWDRVRVGDDFHKPQGENGLRPDELMLAYVTVTRAKVALDRGSLRWIDDFSTTTPAPVETPETPETPEDAEDDGDALPAPLPRPEPADPLSRAVAALRDSHARAGEPGYSDADRAADVRAIVAAYLEVDPAQALAALAAAPAAS